ncbi:Uncharacterised protein [Corynebacterium pilosum]|uniref:Uncharacterized protein n=1 Tax=Corynebacterium pilosum TaxID=35756 RepID=A0A376CPS6_9CORY|nr:Uncharacterised protein [Corynebacterium pilosum]
MAFGGQNLNIIPHDVAAAISKLGVPATEFKALSSTFIEPTGSVFTSVSGLKEMGESHSGVIDDKGTQSRRAFTDRFSNNAAQLRQKPRRRHRGRHPAHLVSTVSSARTLQLCQDNGRR